MTVAIGDIRERFDSRTTFTVALDEEVMVLDSSTYALEPSLRDVRELTAGDERFRIDASDTRLGIVTPVSGNAVAAALHLADLRLELAERLDGEHLMVSAGAHPFSSRRGEVSDVEPSAFAGLHVHVAVPGSDRALAIYNAARSYLPELCALGANAPILAGADTGIASIRAEEMIVGDHFGGPPAFPSWDAFVDLADRARRRELGPGSPQRWWGLRPNADSGTLELHVVDAQTRVEDAAAVAAVFQSLVAWLGSWYDAGEPLPVHESARIAENARHAARYGTRGYLANLETGELEEAGERIARLLGALEESAERLGLTWALLTARSLLAGNGADRQRYVFAGRGVRGLVEWLVDQTTSSARDYLMQRR